MSVSSPFIRRPIATTLLGFAITLGGALGGQIAATFVAASTLRGLPALTGFTTTFGMAAVFLAGCAAVALLIPSPALAVN